MRDNNDIYTEDEIIKIGNQLENLKGKILMDDDNEFFSLKSFDIQGMNIEKFRLFKPNKIDRGFYIKTLIFVSADKTYTHEDDEMCSLEGINKLMRYRLYYSRLEKNLSKFTIKNNISLKFGTLEVIKS